MESSQITVGVIFIFLPGILALMVSERLTEHPERKGYELFAFAFVLGCLAHVIYGALVWLLRHVPAWHWTSVLPEDQWLSLLQDANVKIQGDVVAVTALVGVILGLMVTYSANYSLLHRFARRLRVSRKFGDVDVWAYLMNSKAAEWVLVRDHTNNLMYEGYIHAFSSTEDPRELILTNATVYTNDSAQKLYDVETVYLSLAKIGVAVELRR